MSDSVRDSIDDFMGQKRLAVAGVSRRKMDFSRILFREFLRRGYDMVPVNPRAEELEERKCFSHIQDVTPPVDGVIVMTPLELAQDVSRDCAEAGVGRVWFYRAIGKGAVDPAAVAYCREKGISVIPGHCPLMFFGDPGLLHRCHAGLMKLIGRFPQ
jgi:predicted CoA-binding protein